MGLSETDQRRDMCREYLERVCSLTLPASTFGEIRPELRTAAGLFCKSSREPENKQLEWIAEIEKMLAYATQATKTATDELETLLRLAVQTTNILETTFQALIPPAYAALMLFVFRQTLECPRPVFQRILEASLLQLKAGTFTREGPSSSMGSVSIQIPSGIIDPLMELLDCRRRVQEMFT